MVETSDGIKYDLKSPCSACPFRLNALPGWLGDYKPEDVIQAIQHEQPFLCHKVIEETTGYDEDFLERAIEAGTAHQCAGAMIFARKMAKLPRDPVHAKAAKAIDVTQPILWPPQKFIEHHRRTVSILPTGQAIPVDIGQDNPVMNKKRGKPK